MLLPLRPAAANQRARRLAAGAAHLLRPRPLAAGATPPPASRCAVPGGGSGAMVCGGFACSKNCLCALNLLYTVRGRRAEARRREGGARTALAGSPSPCGFCRRVGRGGIGAQSGLRRLLVLRGLGDATPGPPLGRGLRLRRGKVAPVGPGFVTAKTWLPGIKIQGGRAAVTRAGVSFPAPPTAGQAGPGRGRRRGEGRPGPPLPFLPCLQMSLRQPRRELGRVYFVIPQPGSSTGLSADW